MVLNLEEYEKIHEAKKPDQSLTTAIKNRLADFTSRSAPQWRRWAAGWVPAVAWLRRYKLRSYLVPDLLAGFTVGIVNIPQGMAYGMLAGLQPLQGLYTSLFLPLIYTFLGTSKHVAVGTFAISSIMTASVLDGIDLSRSVRNNEVSANETSFWCATKLGSAENEDFSERIEIAMVLALLVGLCQVLLGALRLGFLTILLSDELIQGLTTGAACHILTSQIKHAFGVNTGKPAAPIAQLKIYVCLFKHFSEINWAALLTCVICIAILYLTKKFVDPKTRPKLHFPIPIELIIVVIVTFISWKADFKTIFHIKVIGDIPTGQIEPPEVPRIGKWFLKLLPDAFSIAIVAFAIEVSVAKHFAKKYNYVIDSNQEWFALGFAHIFGSFFHCHPGGASMSRSSVQGAQGGKSQIVGLINCMVILVVLLALAGLFRDLPKGVLSAIIMVSLRGMLMQITNLPSIFRKSKIDFLIWVVTFATTMVFDVIWGLTIGVLVALLTTVARSLWPQVLVLQELRVTEKYHESNTFAGLNETDNLKIVRFSSPLYYGNAEFFKTMVYQHIEINPVEAKRKKLKRKKDKGEKKSSIFSLFHFGRNPQATSNVEPWNVESLAAVTGEKGNIPLSVNPSTMNAPLNPLPVRNVVIDCSMISHVDLMGAEALVQVFQECAEIEINVLLANLSASVRSFLEDCRFFEKISKKNCFMDVSDAVKKVKEDNKSDNFTVVHV